MQPLAWMNGWAGRMVGEISKQFYLGGDKFQWPCRSSSCGSLLKKFMAMG